MKSLNKTLPAWAAAVALGAAAASVTPALAQPVPDSVLAERRAKEEERRAERQDGASTREERRQERREREQLENMPRPVRRLLRAETEGASNVDYYKDKGEGKEPTAFGAKFTKADGHNYDLRVDREGNVVSRTDLTAQAQQAASAQRPATPAPTPAPVPPPVAQQPTTPAPTTPAPAPAQPPATTDTTARRLQPNEIPANIRAVLDRESKGGTDVKYYRASYGHTPAYVVNWDVKGDERKTYVDDQGNVLTRKGANDENAQTASSREKAPGNDKDDDKIGRVELSATPKAVQTQFRRLTEGASNVKFYRTRYGRQDAFQANYTTKDGKDHKVYVDESGKILSQKDEGSDRKN